MLAALALAAPLYGAPKGDPAKAPSCGSTDATTVFEGSRARVYVAGEPPFFESDRILVAFDSQLYGCLVNGDRSWRLDRRVGLYLAGFFTPETIKLRVPWIALMQQSLIGKDSGRLDVVAVNLRTGERRLCPVSEGFDGETDGMVMTKGGRVGWLGESVPPLTDPRWGRVPAVGLCGAGGMTLIEASPGIELGSLRLVGSTLQWVNAGELKSYPL